MRGGILSKLILSLPKEPHTRFLSDGGERPHRRPQLGGDLSRVEILVDQTIVALKQLLEPPWGRVVTKDLRGFERSWRPLLCPAL